MNETWLKINGYSRYEVSNSGFIRSVINKNITIYIENGYKRISILNDEGIHKKEYIHRLVAVSFISNPDNKPMVNHINGIKTDNRIENIEWCTAKENVNHAINNGLRFRYGGHLFQNKLTEKDILEIRSKTGISRKELAIKYGVCEKTIYRVMSNRTWKGV